MPLKEETVKAPDFCGNDAGKLYHIKPMAALEAEWWGMRALFALKGTSGFIPLDVEANIARFGMVGVAIRGLNAFLSAAVRPEDIKPLLDEMLRCVSRIRDPKRPDIRDEKLIAQDFEEVRTILWLRGEILRVHTGFSVAEVFSRLTSAMNQPEALTTQTSPP